MIPWTVGLPVVDEGIQNNKYVLEGSSIGFDDSDEKGGVIFQFESIHNYIELPREMYTNFVNQLEQESGQEWVAGGCSQ